MLAAPVPVPYVSRSRSRQPYILPLDTARRRPLAETLTIRRGKAKGKRGASLTDVTRERPDRTARERALIDTTLVLTDLRT